MEGYYWRIVDRAAGRVVVALCGVCKGRRGSWAVVALASEPGGFLRHAVVSPAVADAGGFGARAGDALHGSLSRLTVSVGDARVDARLRPSVAWPARAFGALGPAHAVPGLPQYWQPVLLAADVEGSAELGDSRLSLDGASVYVEKNWGPRFPQNWWWGEADAFPGERAIVAFAGGAGALGRVRLAATAVLVRLHGEVLRLSPPAALVRAATSIDSWLIRARSPRHAVEIEAGPAETAPQLLPVPHFPTEAVQMRSVHHLAGRLRLRVRRGARTLFDEESPLAGLERGVPAQELSGLRPAGRRP